MVQNLETCLGELLALMRENKRVYVHCTAGINRSSSVVLAYLVKVEGMPPESALRFLRLRRPQVNPYAGVISYLSTHR